MTLLISHLWPPTLAFGNALFSMPDWIETYGSLAIFIYTISQIIHYTFFKSQNESGDQQTVNLDFKPKQWEKKGRESKGSNIRVRNANGYPLEPT